MNFNKLSCENFFQIAKPIILKGLVLFRNLNIPKLPVLNLTKDKRILFIASDNNKSSGAFLCLVQLCDILMRKYDVDVFVILPPVGDGKSILDEKNIPNVVLTSCNWVIELSVEKNIKFEKEINDKKLINDGAIKKLRTFLTKNNFNLVHINTSYSYIGAIAALEENIPFVWHMRELLEEGQNNTLWDRKKGNQLINKANKVITVSNTVNKKYSSFIDNDKLITIYDGIGIEKFYSPQKEIFEDAIIKIIFVGGISEQKGIYDFCNACIKLYNKFKNLKILIVGTGDVDVIDEISMRFIKSGMGDMVEMLGFQKEVNKFLAKSDIFCMCSKYEAFGRTTVEAMLAGNFVVGANTAGTTELIENGVTGILYNQGNSDDLCEKMLWAIKNKTKAKEIAKNGCQYMFENMSAERNADEIYQLYEEILD